MDQSLQSFCELTQLTPEQAKGYLEAANGNLEGALDLFYSGNTNQPSAVKTEASSKPKPQKGNIATFNQIASSDEESEDEGQTYFAGGDKSGILMKGKGKEKPNNPPEIIQQILEQAAKGAQERQENESSKPAFVGQGFRLGDESSPRIPATNQPAAPSLDEPVERVLTFWKDGFSLDDGELCDYNDPKHKEFLAAISSGRAPVHFLNVKPGQAVDLKVAHRMQESYQPPAKKPVKFFSGQGQRLGTTSSPSVSFPGAFPERNVVPAATSVQPVTFDVNNNAPITQIQLRLADGTRLVSKFNHSHTVGDIRRFINMSRVGESSRRYTLMTTFPHKELTDDNQSLTDAGLLNAVIVQKYL